MKDGPNEKYYEASLRVIHLLKQPTKENPSLPDLIKEIVRENKLGKKFMYRVAQRSYGLLNNFEPWKQVCKFESKALGEALLQSGIVNIRHDLCANTTPQDNLVKWANEHIEHWHGQIKNCKPRLVVCGGTFHAVKQAIKQTFKQALQPQEQVASTGMKWFIDPVVEGCIYIDAPHPTARYPVAMVYTYIMTSAREILKNSS